MENSPHDRERLAHKYVRHHDAAAKGGLDLFRRAARGQSDARTRAELSRLAEQVAQDRAAMHDLMADLGIPPAPLWAQVVAAGERVARLKPNGRLLERSPLSDLVELEALSAAVAAKAEGWRTLRVWADGDPRLDAGTLDALLDRADHQRNVLEGLRLDAAARLAPPAP